MQCPVTATRMRPAASPSSGARPGGFQQQTSDRIAHRACLSQRSKRRASPVLAAAATGIEAVGGVRPEIDAAVLQALGQCLTDTDLGMGKKYKVGRRPSAGSTPLCARWQP